MLNKKIKETEFVLRAPQIKWQNEKLSKKMEKLFATSESSLRNVTEGIKFSMFIFQLQIYIFVQLGWDIVTGNWKVCLY